MPKEKELEVRIGPLIEYGELSRMGGPGAGAPGYRKIARRLEEAVSALAEDPRRKRKQDLDRTIQLAGIMRSLHSRYQPNGLERSIVYYFSVTPERSNWTIVAGPQGCEVHEGKKVDQADCVLKTSSDVLLRILKDGYVPPVSDFVKGKVKTNAPDLLTTFRTVFRLAEP